MSVKRPSESHIELAETEESPTGQLPNGITVYALVIGINIYRFTTGAKNLEAAVADADAIEELLLSRLRAPPSNIISLRNAQATRRGILDAFKLLEEKTAATVDPCIIIYFAGHGASTPRPPEWELWATDRDRIEQLCPSDLGAVVDGRVIEGIPDRVICGLLNSLAQKRGNNITLIVDCCHAAGINREEGSMGTSRRIADPPPITAEANSLVGLSMPERFAYPADASEGATGRALQIASGFGNRFDHSHVLLAACGRDQSAYEKPEMGYGVRGVFTLGLLAFFERVDFAEVTYESIVANMVMPRWQTPHCMGAHTDRPIFSRPGARDPSYLTCEPSGSNFFHLYAGEVQGIALNQRFSLHEIIPTEGADSYSPIGTVRVVSLGFTFSRLEFVRASARPHQRRPVFYLLPLCYPDQEALTIYCQDRQLLKVTFPSGEGMKHADNRTQAALILSLEGDEVYIDQNDPALNGYIPTRFPCKFKRSESPERLRNIIRSWRHFNYHLHRVSEDQTAFPHVRMELRYLKSTAEHGLLHPVGDNLLANEPAEVTVSAGDASLLGMTLYNDGYEDVYPTLFYFDPNDLTIIPWVTPAKSADRVLVDVPLLPHSKLTLGYGNGGASPWQFVFTDDRRKDIGFFKLFLSSKPINFSCLTRTKSPFVYDQGQRLGRDLDQEAEHATRLQRAIMSTSSRPIPLRWRVQMATLIQIRK